MGDPVLSDSAPMPAPRLVLVEDDRAAAERIAAVLRSHFASDCLTSYRTIAQALVADYEQVDLVLTDMTLPDGTGLELLDRLLSRRADLPVVLITGESILANAVKAIQRGACDYVIKAGAYLSALPLVVEKNLAIARTKRENHRLHEQLTRTLEQVQIKNRQLEEVVTRLETAAATDPLTGLANRRALGEALERSFAECGRYGNDLACIMIDLDGFKQFNDSFGHQKGDMLLQTAAQVLGANCRRSDVAGRYGGDEFVVLLPHTDIDTAKVVARRIADQFSYAADGLFEGNNQRLAITMSMGVATLHHSRPVSAEQLIAHADHALYRAKNAGKTCVMLFSPTASDPQHVAKSA